MPDGPGERGPAVHPGGRGVPHPKGETSDALYLIQSGTVLVGNETEGGGLAPLLTVGPGGVVGWSWMVPPYDWKFTCRAEEPVSGLMLDAAWLRDRCERNHELGYHLLRELIANLTRRLVASQEQRAAPRGRRDPSQFHDPERGA